MLGGIKLLFFEIAGFKGLSNRSHPPLAKAKNYATISGLC